MRNPTRNLSLILAILAAVLAWSGAAAVAQSEAPLDPMGASFWTGSATFIDGSFTPPVEDSAGPGYEEVLGIGRQMDVASDDPRIAGTMTQVQNARVSTAPDATEGASFIISGTARIDNERRRLGRDLDLVWCRSSGRGGMVRTPGRGSLCGSDRALRGRRRC